MNLALTFLGEKEITSIDDDSDAARVMKTQYVLARDATIESAEWTFAVKRFIPPKLAAAPEFGPKFAFKIPSEIMRVLRVFDDERYWSQYSYGGSRTISQRQADWTVESGNIVTDCDPIYCVGLRRLDDEGSYTNLFSQAFAARLAMMGAYALTESNQKFAAAAAMFQQTIDEAKSRDGQQGTSRRIRNQSLNRSRAGGFGTRW